MSKELIGDKIFSNAIGILRDRGLDEHTLRLQKECDAIEQQAEFDVAAFAKQFKKLQAEQKVATIKSGAELSGTYFKILKANEREKVLQDKIIKYNASIGKAQAYEQANFARISGQVAREQAKLAQIQTVAQTGATLLTMS